MKNALNQKGLTLVELLAVIVIMSILFVLISNIQFTSSEQYMVQTEKNNQLTDLSYTLKVLTKDLRKTGKAPEINGNTYTIGSEIYVFDAAAQSLLRNENILAQPITAFTIESITSQKYKILISNPTDRIDTEIVIRSGS